jgi:catabolite regulation protein CreA
LKREAERIIEELDLLRLLSAYGEARIVGSVALDLIVKLDIDIHLLVDDPDVLEVANGISKNPPTATFFPHSFIQE